MAKDLEKKGNKRENKQMKESATNIGFIILLVSTQLNFFLSHALCICCWC